MDAMRIIFLSIAGFYLLTLAIRWHKIKKKELDKPEEEETVSVPADIVIKFDEQFNAKVTIAKDFQEIINLYPDKSFWVTTKGFSVVVGKNIKDVIM